MPASFLLPTAYCLLPTAYCLLPTASSPVAHQARLVALPVAVLDRGALVVRLLALGERQLDRRPALAVEIDAEGYQRRALALDGADRLLDLALMEEQLAGPRGLVVEAVAVAELGDVAVDLPGVAVVDVGVALGNRALAGAQALHLGARER